MNRSQKELTAVETVLNDVVLGEKKLNQLTERIRRQGEQMSMITDDHIPRLLKSKGVITEITREIESSTEQLTNLVPVTAQAADQICSIIAETEERINNSGNSIVYGLADTEGRVEEIGGAISENCETLSGCFANFTKSYEKFNVSLTASVDENEAILNRQITMERSHIEEQRRLIDERRRTAEESHEVDLLELRNDALKRKLQFGDLKDQLAKLVEEKKSQKISASEGPRKKGFWDFWWIHSIIIAGAILCLSTIAINKGIF